MRNIFIMFLGGLLGLTGCTKCDCTSSSINSIECQRLSNMRKLLQKNPGREKMKITFYSEDSNEVLDEMPFEELERWIFYFAGCCFEKIDPLSNNVIEYDRLECIWKYLPSEKVQNIIFSKYQGEHIEINEPEKIKKVMKLLHKAVEKSSDRFANDEVMSGLDRMQIITDKHKFIIPIYIYGTAVHGIGWTSRELLERLEHWGFHNKYRQPK